MAHNITFSPDAWADYLYWQSEDKKTLKRINKLLQELQRDGAVQGIGKAELLRKIKGMSKRIDDTNRLVYTVENDSIIVLSCRGHYEDSIMQRCAKVFKDLQVENEIYMKLQDAEQDAEGTDKRFSSREVLTAMRAAIREGGGSFAEKDIADRL